jgi:hypothetical protein
MIYDSKAITGYTVQVQDDDKWDCPTCKRRLRTGNSFVSARRTDRSGVLWACCEECLYTLARQFELDDLLARKRQYALRKRLGQCLECGDNGMWRALALFCMNGHGKICG